jgi:O-antigen/teichoic acid export membrane protein
MNYAIRFCIFGIVPCITALYILRGFIINVAFSNKFIAAGDLFATQLAGDLFYLLFYIAATALLATVRLRAYLVFGIFYSVSYIFFFLALKGQLGLKALTVSYLISSLLSFLAVVYYDVKRTRLKVYARNGKLFLWGCAVIAATLFVEASSLLVIASKIGIVFLWLYFMSTNSEKKKVRELVLKKSKALFGYA